jgi:hypothetical protein
MHTAKSGHASSPSKTPPGQRQTSVLHAEGTAVWYPHAWMDCAHVPGLMRPLASASSIMLSPIRSFTLRQGSCVSSLAAMRALTPFAIWSPGHGRLMHGFSG